MWLSLFTREKAYELRIGDWSSDLCSCDLVGVASAAGIGAQEDVLDRLAVVRVGQRIEARIGMEIVRAGLDQRDRRDELVLVVEVARIQRHRSVVAVVGQRAGELAALVGGESSEEGRVGKEGVGPWRSRGSRFR